MFGNVSHTQPHCTVFTMCVCPACPQNPSKSVMSLIAIVIAMCLASQITKIWIWTQHSHLPNMQPPDPTKPLTKLQMHAHAFINKKQCFCAMSQCEVKHSKLEQFQACGPQHKGPRISFWMRDCLMHLRFRVSKTDTCLTDATI